MQSLKQVVTYAGLAVMPNGKRWHHQRRIARPTLEKTTRYLRHGRLGRARSFDELHRWIQDRVGSIPGIGELYLYDTALRISAYLGLLPRRVYLHAGTRIGARALGLDHRKCSASTRQLPLALRHLKPHEIEDVFCIYKNWLAPRMG